ncbi:Uncharacterised protein [Bordetella pertussis]|nr:Uncharacterised protein [Bordetella pertussis]CPP87575.1 Uncharacterised protein [Bordetella pertussis]CRE32046.1 Uncharacterised protein [Bordetella pertussis]CRE33035.1 Uncharacterised protein [Bordetella pertussis]
MSSPTCLSSRVSSPDPVASRPVPTEKAAMGSAGRAAMASTSRVRPPRNGNNARTGMPSTTATAL